MPQQVPERQGTTWFHEPDRAIHGPDFHDVNIMGVAHGLDKERVLAHKAAIDRHLEEAGIAVRYTNVFWGGRSEIKPSEVSPIAYREWCVRSGLDPAMMTVG